jgi:ribosomal protein S12 methylthiotransferase accessory factor
MFLDLGGTVRAQAAKDTLARLKPLLPVFGITRVIAQENLGDMRIPVSISCRPNSRFLSTSQGKGITRELADVSAIMESVETFHAERLPPAVLTASVLELRKSNRRFVEPGTLPMMPGPEFRVDHLPIAWLELKQLGTDEPVLVPRVFLSMDQTAPRDEMATWPLFVSTNGLASGNTLEEALIHGLYELIERHCLFDHRYHFSDEERRDRRMIIDSLRTTPHIDELITRVEEANLNLSVRSIHGPLGIPGFTAMVRPREPGDRTPGAGCGAHYVPEVALSRAITEAVQSRITFISGSRDDAFPWHYHGLDANSDPKRFQDEDVPCRLSLADVPRPPRFSSFAEVLTWTRQRLEQHGFNQTCYFNHQRPEYGDIPVVTVVSPGMRLDLRMATHFTKKPDH